MKINHQAKNFIGAIKGMKIVAFFDRVNSLDLQAVEKQIMCSQNWTAEQAQLVICRYKLFLYLQSLYPATVLVPTQDIDIVWHAHIEVNLLKYIQDCYYLFGYILNHCAAVGCQQNQETHQIHKQAFSTTKALFEEFFGIDILQTTSIHPACCADIPFDTNPAACADLPIFPNSLLH